MNRNYQIIGIFILLVGLCTACQLQELHVNIDPSTAPVTAAFQIDSIGNNGFDPSRVFFKNTSVNADEFSWNFGDPASGSNNTSTSKNPDHLYENPGIYTVQLIAKNSASEEEKMVPSNVTINETKTFSRTYSNSGSSFTRVWDVIALSDGNYMLAGGRGLNNEPDLYLNKINSDGNIVSGYPKVVAQTGIAEIYSIIINSDGNLAAAGYLNASDNFNETKAAFYEFDTNGNLLGGFPKLYGTSRGAGRDLVESPSGDYGFVGDNTGSGITDFFVALTDANGNLKSGFPRQYNEFDFTESATGIAYLDDEFILMGTDQTLGRLWLHRIDKNGNDVAGYPIYLDNRSADSFVVLPDGSLMCVGYSLLTRFDLNGNEFPGFPKTIDNQFRGKDIILTNENDVAFVGELDDNMVLYRTDLNGNILLGFPKTFTDTNGSVANALIQTHDGGFLVAGTAGNSSSSKAFLVKTDSDGVVR